jgi:hypothetical protein
MMSSVQRFCTGWLALLVPISFSAQLYFEIDLTWETCAPDGNPRQMVLVNGQFPGPQLSLCHRDQIELQALRGG